MISAGDHFAPGIFISRPQNVPALISDVQTSSSASDQISVFLTQRSIWAPTHFIYAYPLTVLDRSRTTALCDLRVGRNDQNQSLTFGEGSSEGVAGVDVLPDSCPRLITDCSPCKLLPQTTARVITFVIGDPHSALPTRP